MPSAPLTEHSFEIFNFKCFDDSGSGTFRLQNLNFVIGRNNVGKSAVVDFLEMAVCRQRDFEIQKHGHKGENATFHFTKTFDRLTLKSVFREDTSGGGINGNHWSVGSTLLGATGKYSCDFSQSGRLIDIRHPKMESVSSVLQQMLMDQRFAWPFTQVKMVRIASERDVQPEPMQAGQTIRPNGVGLTNAIARQINDASLSREVAQQHILTDLNEVYQGDAEFTEIITRFDSENRWEVHLRETAKGDIRLSESGSALKTVLLVITLMRIDSNINWSSIIFAIDEPENNLHPALFRRLLEYLARMQIERGFTLVVTTHSPIAIDWAARRNDSQVLHIRHDGRKAKMTAANGYVSGRNILDDLDIRASDILQANGIIWVEGPSDRIYLRKWIDIKSNGLLKEGIHYTIMFYGGKLLSHLSADEPREETDLIALLRMNRNAALLIDSDRRLEGKSKSGRKRRPRMQINGTKRRLKAELENLGGFVWVTEGKEVENYVPVDVYARLVDQPVPCLSSFDDVVSHEFLKTFKEDKIKLAHAVVEILKTEEIEGVLDLSERLGDLCSRIRAWNGI